MPRVKSVFIENNVTGDILYFDAVFDVTYTMAGEATKYRVESGANVSDHYDNLPDVITVRGSVSRFKLGSYGEQVTEMDVMLNKLTSMKRNKELFTVIFDDDLQPLRNCLFNSLDFTKNGETGRHSVDIDMSIQQIQFGSRAGLVLMPEPLDAYKDGLEAYSKKSTSVTDIEHDGYCAEAMSILRVGNDEWRDFVDPVFYRQVNEAGCSFLSLYDGMKYKFKKGK